jgi:hypothetical protein
MKQLALTEATKPLLEYAAELDRTEDGLVLMAGKKPVALLISLADLDEESFWLSMSPKFAAILEQSRKELRSGKKSSLESVKELVTTWNADEKGDHD